jgi:hypothetical protein
VRRIVSIVAVLAVAALVASAQPVAAADAGLEIASENTTDTELGNAAALKNVTVSGSGQSASVQHGRETYNPLRAREGTANDDGADFAFGDSAGDTPFKTEIRVEPDSSGRLSELSLDTGTQVGGDYGFTVEVRLVQEAPDGVTGEGTQIGTWDPDFTFAEQSVSLSSSPQLQAGQTYTLEFLTQSTDNDGTADKLAVKVTDTSSAPTTQIRNNVDGGLNRYVDVTLTLGDSAGDGLYIGQRHDAEQVEQLFANLSLTNMEASVTAQADPDGDGTFTNVTSTTISTSQNVTLDVSATDSTRWRTRVDFSPSAGSTTAELRSEGVLFQASGPSGSGADPARKIITYDGDISLNVSDADFALAQGDSVTVEAANASGGTIGQTTVSSNQTVSLAYSAKAGPNDITWTLTDSYGDSATVSQQFTAPAEIRVFNASDPDQLITGTQNEITVSFFGETEEVFSRTTTDGTVDLLGLPAAPDQGYQIDVEDGADYKSRSVVIDSLFSQQAVYLLPTSTAQTTVEFRLTDRTGRFQQPRLNVRKPISKDFNGDGNTTTQFRTVVSDKFSAAQSLTLTLERGTRHRLEIVNENGATRTLGSYTPSTATDVQQLTIAQVSLAPEPAQTGVGLDASLTEASGQRVVRVVFDDPRNDSTNINLNVARTDLNSNQTVAQQSIAGPIGRQVSTFVVNGSGDAPAYTVEISYDRDGERRQASIQLGNVGEWRLAYLNDQVASLTAWVTTIAITGLVVIRTPRIAAVVAVVLTTLFSTLGIISVGPVPLGIAGATAVLFVVSRGVGQ